LPVVAADVVRTPVDVVVTLLAAIVVVVCVPVAVLVCAALVAAVTLLVFVLALVALPVVVVADAAMIAPVKRGAIRAIAQVPISETNRFTSNLSAPSQTEPAPSFCASLRPRCGRLHLHNGAAVCASSGPSPKKWVTICAVPNQKPRDPGRSRRPDGGRRG